jgi:5-methylcytosine-specific restriction enzyme subunit McrC
MRNNSFQMFEHDKVTEGDPRFTFTHEELIQIERFNERMRQREGLKQKVLGVSRNARGEASIRSSSYVGVLRIGKRTIQILPKIAKKGSEDDDRHEAIFRSAVRNLLFMLSYTKRLPIKEVDLSRLNRVDDNFFEFLIYLFAKNTLELIERNMCKEYVDREENVVFLKGKIKFSSHIKHNAALKHRFYTEFDDFSADNLLNQILKYTTYLLLGACSSPDNAKKLQQIYFMLDDVSLRKIIPELFNKVKLTRLNDEYVPVLNLCKLVIERAALELRAGQLDVFSFVFDMNVLFEEFIGEFIKREFAGEFCEITLKRPVIHFAQKYVDGVKPENVLPLKPDIVIEKTDGEGKLIIDTKYKELTGQDKKEGADRSDIYQMYAYSKKYCSPSVIMLYPQFKEQKKASNFYVGDGTIIHIRTVNVCRDLKNDRKDLHGELQEILCCAR